MAKPSSEEIAWAAGVFIADGSFTFMGRRGQSRINPLACVAMNDEDVVRRFAAIVEFGTCHGPYTRKGGLRYWQWQVTNRAGFQALYDLFEPWLSDRYKYRAAAILMGERP